MGREWGWEKERKRGMGEVESRDGRKGRRKGGKRGDKVGKRDGGGREREGIRGKERNGWRGREKKKKEWEGERVWREER